MTKLLSDAELDAIELVLIDDNVSEITILAQVIAQAKLANRIQRQAANMLLTNEDIRVVCCGTFLRIKESAQAILAMEIEP